MQTPEKATIDELDNAPTNLPAPVNEYPVENVANLLKKVKDLSQEKEDLEAENSRLKRDKRTTEILDGLIHPFAKYTFIFMCAYCAFVAKILWDQQSGTAVKPLADDILKLLVGSTAVTVIGLVGMVLTGIFVGARPK